MLVAQARGIEFFYVPGDSMWSGREVEIADGYFWPRAAEVELTNIMYDIAETLSPDFIRYAGSDKLWVREWYLARLEEKGRPLFAHLFGEV